MAFKAAVAFDVKNVCEPTPGLALARNSGLNRACGDIVAFTDDDCYVEPDFLAKIMQSFKDPDVGYLGGRICLHDPTDAPVTILESKEPKTFNSRTYVRAGEIQGANMAFRRAPLLQVGGFDPLFGSGAYFPAEDIDAVASVGLAGWMGVYDPEVVVYHHHGRKLSDLPALMKAYDRGRGAYHMKLLLKHGRLRWFLFGAAASVRRLRTSRRGVLHELQGGLEYAWRAFLSATRGPKA